MEIVSVASACVWKVEVACMNSVSLNSYEGGHNDLDRMSKENSTNKLSNHHFSRKCMESLK